MKEFILLGTKRGAKKRELLAGPEVPYSEQRLLFKKLKVARTDAKFESVEWCELQKIGNVRLLPAPEEKKKA